MTKPQHGSVGMNRRLPGNSIAVAAHERRRLTYPDGTIITCRACAAVGTVDDGARAHAPNCHHGDPLTGAAWGYTCLVGLPHHGTQWLPKRFREASKAALAALEKELPKLTKAKLAVYIVARGGLADGRERKPALVTAAINAQMARLFPYRDPQPGDRDG